VAPAVLKHPGAVASTYKEVLTECTVVTRAPTALPSSAGTVATTRVALGPTSSPLPKVNARPEVASGPPGSPCQRAHSFRAQED
jgi:hypothetical protein